jgi:predicted hydrocarbon binding protein
MLNEYVKRDVVANDGIRIDSILLEVKALRKWAEAMSLEQESGAAPFLFLVGRIAGRHFGEVLVERGVQLKKLPEFLKPVLVQGGWGDSRIDVKLEEKTARIVIENCVAAKKARSAANCHLIRGYIAGVSDVLFNTIPECTETRCRVSGSPICWFRVASPHKQI